MGSSPPRIGGWRRRAPLIRARDDPHAFDAVFKSYWDAVLRYMTRRTFDAEVAFDLTAETFATMLANIRSLRGDTEDQARAWMWAIARSELRQWRDSGSVARRNRDRLAVDAGTPGTDELERIEELADIEPLRAVVRAALSTLDPKPRRVLELRVINEWSYDEVARELGITTNAAQIRVARALAMLEDEVLRHLPDEDDRSYSSDIPSEGMLT